MRKLLLWLSIIFFILSIFMAKNVCWSALCPEAVGNGPYILLSSFLSLSVVSIGWWVSLFISQRQTTLNIIAQSRLSESYLSRISLVRRDFPLEDGFLKKTVIEDPKNKEALEALVSILNFLEFISIGIEEKDLSEKVCKSFFKVIFATQWRRSKRYISYIQATENERIYKTYEKYTLKWNPELKD